MKTPSWTGVCVSECAGGGIATMRSAARRIRRIPPREEFKIVFPVNNGWPGE
jgi:hypothetical protein